jgi:hypothetical protein
MENSPSKEAKSNSPTQKLLKLKKKKKTLLIGHQSLPLIPSHSQIIPVHILLHCFFMGHFNPNIQSGPFLPHSTG